MICTWKLELMLKNLNNRKLEMLNRRLSWCQKAKLDEKFENEKEELKEFLEKESPKGKSKKGNLDSEKVFKIL